MRPTRHGTIAVLVTLVLLVTVGVCLAHAADEPGPDLCGSAVLGPVALATVSLLSPGRCVPARPAIYRFAPGEPPTLPPRA